MILAEEVNGQRHLEHQNRRFSFQSETRTDLQLELRGKEKRKEEAKNMPKPTPREETAYAGSQKASVHLEKHAHSSMTRRREVKGRDDFVHFLRQVHRTEFRKVTEKVAMTEVVKGTPTFTGDSQAGKANRLLCVIIGMFPNVKQFQVRANSETSVHTNA